MISQEEISFYKQIIDQMQVVFDVGCQHDNIFHELKPGISVHLFDPVVSQRLMDKISGHSNIHFNNYALGNHQGSSVFHKAYGSILYRGELGPDNDHSESFIQVDRLDNYCIEKDITSIDFLKIDTEGFDFEVIKGCGEMLKSIRFIQFEHWNDEQAKTIIDYLQPAKITRLNSKPVNYIAELL